MESTATARKLPSLRDRLSRLNYTTACQLLGENGKELIKLGGTHEIRLDEQVYVGEDLFRLTLPNAVVTITAMAEARNRLRFNCTSCEAMCEHVGAALALILEEKMLLGLAAPPRERVPIESLSEDKLIEQALAERRERARTENMSISSTNPNRLWTDYLVTNRTSGKTYRVALRGWERGQSYCTCPDYRKNTLGTCKHIMRVIRKIRKRFSVGACRRPFVPKDLAVYLQHGEELELRLLAPPGVNGSAGPLIRPISGRAIGDIPDLLRRVQKLEILGHKVLIYPDAEEYISQQLFRNRIAAKAAEIRRNPKDHPLRKSLLKVELLPYQLDGIAFAIGAGRAILADDMGLGKTIQGIGVAEMLAREANIGKVLIVCPTSLKSQWRSEIQRFANRDCQLVLGGAAERATQYENDKFFTICNYEQVMRDILSVERVKWDLIILDEGQRIRNWETKTSRVIKGLRSPFALVLSGTPLENRLDDLFSVAEFIDDRRLGPAFRFFNRHRITDETGYVLGYKNLDDLRNRLKPILLRRTRDLVMRQLPPRTTEIVRIAPTAEQYMLHKAGLRVVSSIVRKPFLTEMDLLRLKQALMICRMSADSTYLVDKKEPAYSSKLEHLDGLLEQLVAEENRKILLFSEWTTMLDLIEPLLNRRKIAFVRLDGSIPQKKRQPLVNAFQNDPRIKMFITTNAGATGLNLQAANTVINVDLPWNPAVLEQRISRAHRMGQKQPVQVFVLVTESTIEENLLGTLSAKHNLAMAALDAESDVSQVNLTTGIDELKRRLEVLIGAKPYAPVDESEKRRVAEEAERLARNERIGSASGQLLTAALGLMSELLPERPPTPESEELAGTLRARLSECITQDEQGRHKLTVTLGDSAAVDNLVNALAKLLSFKE